MQGADAVVRAIQAHRSFLVTAHRNPEADALGSSLALAYLLRQIGKQATVVTIDPVPRVLNFLPHVGIHRRIERLDEPPEVLCVLDCGDAERTGLFMPGTRAAKTVVNIDHHITNRMFGDVNWVVAEAAATAELIYDLHAALKQTVGRDAAVCLYTALASETGNFGYSNTSPKVFRVAADLVELGVDPWQVAQHLRENTPQRLKLMGEVLGTMDRAEAGRIAWVSVTQAMFARTGTTAEDTEDFVNLPRSLPNVEVAVLFREVDARTCKVSLRARNAVDVAEIAERFGGGGHKKAAGCTVAGSLDEARRALLAAITAALPKR